MAFHEKDLSFESNIVDLFSGEQLKSWFLVLNSKGEVPVLKDTVKIIPDSERIIDYIEDNFSNGGRPQLVPMDQGAAVRQNVNHFRHLLKTVPAGLLTTGSVLNSHLLKNTKIPFIAPVRRALANEAKNAGTKLRQAAEQNPQAKEVLLEKAAKSEENYKSMCIESNFLSVIKDIDIILTKVEQELASHQEDKKDWWLCSKDFTVADIELTILLERISQLGLEYFFWSAGKKPCIEKYYERVQNRPSYKKTIPGTMFLVKTILLSQAPIIFSVVTAVALILGGAFIAKKYIS